MVCAVSISLKANNNRLQILSKLEWADRLFTPETVKLGWCFWTIMFLFCFVSIYTAFVDLCNITACLGIESLLSIIL